MDDNRIRAISEELEGCSLRMYTYANHFSNLMSRFGIWTGEHYGLLQKSIAVSPDLFYSMEHSIAHHRELLEEFQEVVINISSISADYVAVLAKLMEIVSSEMHQKNDDANLV